MFSKLTCQKSGSKPGCWLTLEAKCIFESTWCLLPSLKSRGAHLRHLFYFSSGTSLPVTCHNQNYCSFPLWWTRKPFANLRSLEVIPDNLSVNCLGMNLSRRSRLQGYTYFVQDMHCIWIDARNSWKLKWNSTSHRAVYRIAIAIPDTCIPDGALIPTNFQPADEGSDMSYIPCTELPFPTDPGPASVAAAPTLDVFSQRKKKKLIRARRFRSTKKSAKPHYLVVNLNRGLGLASHSQCRCTTR